MRVFTGRGCCSFRTIATGGQTVGWCSRAVSRLHRSESRAILSFADASWMERWVLIKCLKMSNNRTSKNDSLSIKESKH